MQGQNNDQSNGRGVQERLSRRVVLGLGAAVAGLVGSVAFIGGGASPSHAAGWFRRHHRHHGHGRWGHGPGGHGPWGGWHRLDAEEMRERADDTARWLVREVDATEEQKQEVRTAIDSMIDDLVALRAEMPDERTQFVEQLTAPAVDRASLHRIRESATERASLAFTRVVDGLADVAEALTPEQRRQLRDEMRKHRRWS
jgi:Spy/CpxP family protein refolding chaperone